MWPLPKWIWDNWELILGFGGAGGAIASLRKIAPSLLAFLADAGTAPYLRAQNKTLKILLEEKTSDYEDLLKDYRTLAKTRRDQADSLGS